LVLNKVFHPTLILAVAGLLTAAIPDRSEPVKLARKGDSIDVSIGGQPFTTFHFEPEYSKSFLRPLRTANGVIVTRQIPVGNEIPPEHEHDESLEPHQRALYLGHGDINGYSFWVERVFSKYYHTPSLKYGRVVFRKLDEMKSGQDSGVIRATFDMQDEDGKTFAEQTQQYKFTGDAQNRMVDCEYVIKAGNAPVVFGDTKEGTFGIRLAPELDAPGGSMINSGGAHGEAEVWGKRANWVDVDGVVNGEKLGVAVFDAPDSFRHPTYWHARGYGLLAANPFGLSYFYHDSKQNGSYTLAAGQSIRFHYGVVIHQGTYDHAGIAQKYQEFAAHP
jgi:Methane oxygenase PmoA